MFVSLPQMHIHTGQAKKMPAHGALPTELRI